MKKLYFAILFFLCLHFASAQVGIGATNPNSQLDIRSSNQATPANNDGVLIPKVDAFSATNPTAAQQGMLVYLTTATVFSGNPKPVGFYYWDNVSLDWIGISSAANGDHDWYEEGTTTAPNTITDDMFHTGNVAIGKNTANYPLEVNSTAFDTGIVNTFAPTATNGVHKYAIDNSITASHNDPNSGLRTTITGTGTGFLYGMTTSISNSGPGNHFGFLNELSGTGTGNQIGGYNFISNSSDSSHTGVYNVITGAGNGIKYGVFNNLASNGNGTQYGNYNNLSGSGNGDKYAEFNSINSTGTGENTGVYNILNGLGTGVKVGVRSQITSTNTTGIYGVNNIISGGGASLNYGVYNTLFGNSTAAQYGTYNNIGNTSTGIHYGTFNTLNGTGVGQKYGVRNELNGQGNQTGIFNILIGTGTGLQIGSYNEISNSNGSAHTGVLSTLTGTGAGNKTGIYSFIDAPAGGTHYGVYSEVLKAGATNYAGYFLGNVGIGTTGGNIYRLPPSRGTVGQTMRTDGAGNVTWANNSDFAWALTGNATAAANFIGTTNAQAFRLYSNNVERMRINPTDGEVVVGAVASPYAGDALSAVGTATLPFATNGYSAQNGSGTWGEILAGSTTAFSAVQGVYGGSGAGAGVLGNYNGTSASNVRAGVFGVCSTPAANIAGAGVYGYNAIASGSSRMGVLGAYNGASFGIGVQGIAFGGGIMTGNNDVAVVGWRANNSNYSGYFNGNHVIANGTKTASVGTSKGNQLLYVTELPEVWFEDVGRGKLINGSVEIKLDPMFLETVFIDETHPMSVFLQEEGDSKGLYVIPGKDGFIVKEKQGGTSNISFSYRIMAKRLHFQDHRFGNDPIWGDGDTRKYNQYATPPPVNYNENVKFQEEQKRNYTPTPMPEGFINYYQLQEETKKMELVKPKAEVSVKSE